MVTARDMWRGIAQRLKQADSLVVQCRNLLQDYGQLSEQKRNVERMKRKIDELLDGLAEADRILDDVLEEAKRRQAELEKEGK
jgi:polyhydroxyalkanoate synthesis regulator phasin